MFNEFKMILDKILQKAVDKSPGIPGVAAMIVNKSGTVYEGVAGKRHLGGDVDMTLDSVYSIQSTTKAITGTVCLQLMERGELDLDIPAKEYAPAIGELQVIEGFDMEGSRNCAPRSQI